MFISKILTTARHGDHYYIAKLNKRSSKYIWTRVPLMPGPEMRINAKNVPEYIREKAYDMFEGDRERA